MDTIIVEILVPAISANFDFALPAQSRVAEAAGRIAEILKETTGSVDFDGENLMLLDPASASVLNSEATLAEAGIRDGARLFLL